MKNKIAPKRLKNGKASSSKITKNKSEKSGSGKLLAKNNFLKLDSKEALTLLKAIGESQHIAISAFKPLFNKKNKIIDFEWVFANSFAEKAAGHIRLTGKYYLEIFSGKDKSNHFKWYKETFETAKSFETQYSSPLKGNNTWTRTAISKFNGSLLVYDEDITQRKNKEELIEENSIILQSIFDTTLFQMYVMKAIRNTSGKITDFRIMIVNKEVEKDTQRKDLIGKMYIKAFPGIKNSGIFADMVKVVETGMTKQIEFAYTHNKLINWYSSMFVKMEDGIVVTNLDVTERKKADEDRLKNLVLLQQSEDLSKMGSWDYDLKSQEFSWSDGMYKLFDMKKKDKVIPEVYIKYATREANVVAERIAKKIRKGSGSFEETLSIKTNGSIKVIRLKADVIKQNELRSAHVLGVDVDITAISATEKKYHELQENQRLLETKRQSELLALKLLQQREILNTIIITQEQERERIGEALHNGVSQLLYGIQIRLQLIQPDNKEERKKLEEIMSITTEAINDTRQISFELVPAVLKDFGVEAALKALFERIIVEKPVIELKVNGLSNRLTETIEFALYRIVQELVNNIIKHSNATHASVEFNFNQNILSLIVTDNGVGMHFTETSGFQKGIGLQTVKNRIELLGGNIKYGKVKGNGTMIIITIPVHGLNSRAQHLQQNG